MWEYCSHLLLLRYATAVSNDVFVMSFYQTSPLLEKGVRCITSAPYAKDTHDITVILRTHTQKKKKKRAVLAHATQPNATHLDDVKNLPRSLLHFAHLVHQVPELGSGGDLVRRENLHSVNRWVGLLIRGGLAPHNLILAHPDHLKAGERKVSRYCSGERESRQS